MFQTMRKESVKKIAKLCKLASSIDKITFFFFSFSIRKSFEIFWLSILFFFVLSWGRECTK